MLISHIDRKALAMTTLCLNNAEAKIPSLPCSLGSVSSTHKHPETQRWVIDQLAKKNSPALDSGHMKRANTQTQFFPSARHSSVSRSRHIFVGARLNLIESITADVDNSSILNDASQASLLLGGGSGRMFSSCHFLSLSVSLSLAFCLTLFHSFSFSFPRNTPHPSDASLSYCTARAL